MKQWRRWQDWTVLVLGMALFLSPWVFRTTALVESTWNAWIVGGAMVLIALWALARPQVPMPEWINAILGVWLIIAPWMLFFASTGAASWTTWIIGLLLIALAALTLYQTRSLQRQRATS